ncbi:MAG TPA: NUDIX domain-containing protein [Deltaproteobacteria bacterium]|jgi:translation initiation factor 2B subunit (eIF-2B alpha/beta/delta family)|nr:NUDIX domain-containing protein [Deltaproteobacteria bacterium]
MNFRDTHCVWCRQKSGPLEDCARCPRFRKHELGQDTPQDSEAFCSVCRNHGDEGLATFCATNRRLQQGSGEPFDCYKFDPDVRGGAKGQTHVVTVFLTHRDKVCLVRRSQAVGTYRGRWSGISGYLEGDPGRHFMTELKEETSLAPADYTLLRASEPVAVEDEVQSRIWYVHPFLCEVHDPSKIRLDWENTELAWLSPAEMRGLDTVPGLEHVFRRVSRMPLESETAGFVQTMRDDRVSGARQLAYSALDFLGRLVRSSNAASPAVLVDDLHYACHEIGMARPSMAIVSTTLELLLRDVAIDAGTGIDQARSGVLSLIRRHVKEMDFAMDRAVEHIDRIVPPGSTVLFHSYSSSLVHALPLLRDKGCTLVVTESRPGFEGRTVARVAQDMGVKVRLVTDAAAGIELRGVHVVLMGSDSVEADGSVINKTGSSLIAMAAHGMGVKVYFVSELRKIRAEGSRAELEEYGPEEVWETAPAGVEVGNVYFDRTAPEFITGIILEEGIAAPEAIREKALFMTERGRA